MNRRAMTLLEVVIALGLFTVVMGAVFECLTGVRQYVGRETVQNDLVLQGRRLIDTIVQDLASTTWYIAPTSVGGPDFSITPNPLQDPAKDRQIKYYPYIQVRSTLYPAGRGQMFPAFSFAASEQMTATTIPSALPAAHRLPSQEIIFVKIADAPPSATPPDTTPDIAFGGNLYTPAGPPTYDYSGLIAPYPIGISYQARYQTYDRTRHITSPSLGLTVNASNLVVDTPVQYESAIAGATESDYREYGYVVVPDASTGKGRLERRYRNASDQNATPVPATDRVLSTDVDRIVFDTYRTDALLNANQIRVRIYLSRALEDGTTFVTHEVEAVVAMRATDCDVTTAAVTGQLGGGGTFNGPVVP